MPFDSKTMRVVKSENRGPRPRIGTSELLVDEDWEMNAESDDLVDDDDDDYDDEVPVEIDDDLIEVVSSLSVAEVIELVESGEAELDDVIEAEREGKSRKTILALVKSDSGKVYPVSGKGVDG